MLVLALAIAIVGLFFSGFFSGVETGLYRYNRLRLHLGVRQRQPASLRLERVLQDEPGALSVALVGTNVANYVTTTTVAYLFAELLGLGEGNTELYTVVIVTPIVFVFGETVPKNLFRLHADTLMTRGSYLLAVFNRLFRMTGVVWLLTGLAAAINRGAGLDSETRSGFEAKRRVARMLQDALAQRTTAPDQSDLIDRVCRISETPVHAVMVPRNRVQVIAATTRQRELLRIARRTGYARLPVFDRRPHRITGLVRVDDLLQSDDWTTIGEQAERARVIRPHETVASAIAGLQRNRQSMAIVTDRGGQMLGIVTLKDLLREVVGDVAEDV